MAEKKGSKKEEVVGRETLVEVTLTGKTPLLMNPISEEVLDGLRGTAKTRKTAVKDMSVEDEARAKVYSDDKGKPGIPVEMLIAALRAAGTLVKYEGKKNVSKADGTTLMFIFLSIEGEFFTFKGNAEWTADKRAGRNPNTGGAACIVRPKFKEWEIDLVIEVDTAEIAMEKVQRLFEMAGRAYGLGDFRTGGFGRFRVTKWEEAA